MKGHCLIPVLALPKAKKACPVRLRSELALSAVEWGKL